MPHIHTIKHPAFENAMALMGKNESLSPKTLSRSKFFLHKSLFNNTDGVGFGPQTPDPGPITFRLRLD